MYDENRTAPLHSTIPHPYVLMAPQSSTAFGIPAPPWVAPLVITLGILCGAAVAAVLGALVFAIVSIRAPAVPPDPTGFTELLQRREASLASLAIPTPPIDERAPQILDSAARQPSLNGSARTAPAPLIDQSGDHSSAVLLAGQAAPITVDPTGRLNVLLLGVDAADRFTGNTDVIMLLSADITSGSVALISFPRDLCIADCNRSSDRLNGVYSRYGADAMLQVMTELTGQPIEYYTAVHFEGFARIIDRLGGVDIIADRDFNDIVPDPDGTGGVLQLSRGENHLDGTQALMFARSRRYDAAGDFARICRQQQIVVSSIATVLHPATLIDLPSLLLDLGDAVKSNLPMGDLVELLRLASTVSLDDITREVILNDGITGTVTTGSDGSYLIRAGQDAIRADVADATLSGTGGESTSACPSG